MSQSRRDKILQQTKQYREDNCLTIKAKNNHILYHDDVIQTKAKKEKKRARSHRKKRKKKKEDQKNGALSEFFFPAIWPPKSFLEQTTFSSCRFGWFDSGRKKTTKSILLQIPNSTKNQTNPSNQNLKKAGIRGQTQCLTEPKEEMALLRVSRLVASNKGGCWTDGSAGNLSFSRVSFLVWTWVTEGTHRDWDRCW